MMIKTQTSIWYLYLLLYKLLFFQLGATWLHIPPIYIWRCIHVVQWFDD